ncbi:MAG: hypothetical protein ACO39B_16935, partial [bacterium]
MKAALQYLHEILTLLGDDRRKIPLLLILFLVLALIEMAGIGLILPYIELVLKGGRKENSFVDHYLSNLDLTV